MEKDDSSGIQYLLYGREHWDIAKMIIHYKKVPKNLYNHYHSINYLISLLEEGEKNLTERATVDYYWNKDADEKTVIQMKKWVKAIENYYGSKNSKLTPHL